MQMNRQDKKIYGKAEKNTAITEGSGRGSEPFLCVIGNYSVMFL